MSGPPGAWPRFKPVGDRGLLVEFAERFDEEAWRRVRALDAALSERPFAGLKEWTPSYASLLVIYDPLIERPASVAARLSELIVASPAAPDQPATHTLAVCYDEAFGPDLAEVAARLAISVERVIETHLATAYRVIAYGFAPGYAYLGTQEQALSLPRKESARRDVAAGSVIIAGAQCLVTTLKAPTGWWIVGRSPERLLTLDRDPPVRFAVGDIVRFHRIDREGFEAHDASRDTGA